MILVLAFFLPSDDFRRLLMLLRVEDTRLIVQRAGSEFSDTRFRSLHPFEHDCFLCSVQQMCPYRSMVLWD